MLKSLFLLSKCCLFPNARHLFVLFIHSPIHSFTYSFVTVPCSFPSLSNCGPIFFPIVLSSFLSSSLPSYPSSFLLPIFLPSLLPFFLPPSSVRSFVYISRSYSLSLSLSSFFSFVPYYLPTIFAIYSLIYSLSVSRLFVFVDSLTVAVCQLVNERLYTLKTSSSCLELEIPPILLLRCDTVPLCCFRSQVCPNCDTKFPTCIVTGRPLMDYQFWMCATCKHRAYEHEISTLNHCPLCHAPI